MFRALGVIALFFSVSSFANDTIFKNYLRLFQVKALPTPEPEPRAWVELGKRLFRDPILSGNKNISCNTCHALSTSVEPLPLSLGEGAVGVGANRKQRNGEVIPRNAMALFNLGYSEVTHLFHDGRVSYNPQTRTYNTPVAALNGRNPMRSDITRVLDGALSAQVLFPLLSREEMRGKRGTNELANAQSASQIWDLIVRRIERAPGYTKLLRAAYPNARDINAGHLAKAIASYIRHQFLANNTPLDRYLRGDLRAMTAKQKQGGILFFGRGRCGSCHFGPHLSQFGFRSVAVPQLGRSGSNDRGRLEVSGRVTDLYRFRVSPLRNVALTAPYFHDGIAKTLTQVITHYSSPSLSFLNLGSFNGQRSGPNQNYSPRLSIDLINNTTRLATLDPTLAVPLLLNPIEIEYIREFLAGALTDTSFRRR